MTLNRFWIGGWNMTCLSKLFLIRPLLKNIGSITMEDSISFFDMLEQNKVSKEGEKGKDTQLLTTLCLAAW